MLSLHETQVNLTNAVLRERSQTEKILHDSTVRTSKTNNLTPAVRSQERGCSRGGGSKTRHEGTPEVGQVLYFDQCW